ncbi:integrase core domain-containing protein [Keguizhuia sedimenti]|uniref:integrase core domain-containing protein n=1 Tax=Keguizhuia sedimenti TaxID=3064264 RepID=UPI003BAE9097
MSRLRDQNVRPACTKPDRSWQNGFFESFNGKLRNEFNNNKRPHSALAIEHRPERAGNDGKIRMLVI